MRLKRNYYEVMGLSRDATALEVKKKYHELVRQFHPDRASDKELAARLFSQINRAYRTLNDAELRSFYNASLQAEEANNRVVTNPPVPHQQAPSQQSLRQESEKWVSGQASQQPDISRPAPTAPLLGRASPNWPDAATLAQWLDEANKAYFRNDREAAGGLVNKLLKHDQNNPDVLRLAGDIFADTGRRKEALAAYKKALAAQGSNALLQAKIARLQAALNAGSGGQDLTAKRPVVNRPGGPGDKPSLLKRLLGGSR